MIQNETTIKLLLAAMRRETMHSIDAWHHGQTLLFTALLLVLNAFPSAARAQARGEVDPAERSVGGRPLKTEASKKQGRGQRGERGASGARRPLGIAFVDVRRALNETEEGRMAMKALTRLKDDLQQRLDTEEERIKALWSSLMEEESKPDFEAQLARYKSQVEGLRQQYDEFSRTLKSEEERHTRSVLTGLEERLRTLGESGRYLVISSIDSGAVAWGAPALDVTEALIRSHDLKYSKQRGSAARRAKERRAQKPRSEDGMRLADRKIAFIDLRRALNETQDGKAAMKSLVSLKNALQSKLDREEAALQKQRNAYHRQIKEGNKVDPADKARIEAKEAELTQKYRKHQKRLYEKEASLTAAILKGLGEQLAHIGESGGYAVIFDVSSGTLAWGLSQLDLTDRLMALYEHPHSEKEGHRTSSTSSGNDPGIPLAQLEDKVACVDIARILRETGESGGEPDGPGDKGEDATEGLARIRSTLGRMAEQEGYALIFDISSEAKTYWITPTLDVTDQAVRLHKSSRALSRGKTGYGQPSSTSRDQDKAPSHRSETRRCTALITGGRVVTSMSSSGSFCYVTQSCEPDECCRVSGGIVTPDHIGVSRSGEVSMSMPGTCVKITSR